MTSSNSKIIQITYKSNIVQTYFCCSLLYDFVRYNNNDRLTAFDPGQPG